MWSNHLTNGDKKARSEEQALVLCIVQLVVAVAGADLRLKVVSLTLFGFHMANVSRCVSSLTRQPAHCTSFVWYSSVAPTTFHSLCYSVFLLTSLSSAYQPTHSPQLS